MTNVVGLSSLGWRALARGMCAVALVAAVAVHTPALPTDQPGAAYNVPAVSLEGALAVANRAVRARQIDITAHYLYDIHLETNPRGDRGAFWVVRWQPRVLAKGGQIYVQVYMDKTTEITFSE